MVAMESKITGLTMFESRKQSAVMGFPAGGRSHGLRIAGLHFFDETPKNSLPFPYVGVDFRFGHLPQGAHHDFA